VRRVLLIVAACAAVPLASCTSTPRQPPTTPDVTVTQTRTATRTVAPDPRPIVAGPTTAAGARGCPLVAKQTAADNVGMRLARITVLRSGGSVIGCQFFALQGSPLATSEHLPGPKQPVISLVTSRYGSALAAHNAMVLLARAGTSGSQVRLHGGVVGVVYRTNFDPHDHGRDWVCAFARGTGLTVIKTVVTDTSVNAVALANAVLGVR
jgi:hypothetical protein